MKSSHLKLFSVISIVLMIVLTMGALGQLDRLKFDYSFESFFPIDDPDLAYYEDLTKAFGQQNDFLFLSFQGVALENTEDLEQLLSIEKQLEHLDHVQSVQSHFDEAIYQITPFGLNTIPKYPVDKPITANEISQYQDEGKYFGKDGRSVLMILRHSPFLSKADGDTFYDYLSQTLTELSPFEVIISGKIEMQKAFTDQLEGELGMLLVGGLSVCLVILFLLFRSPKKVFFAVLVMLLTLVWTMGIMAMLDKPIDVMIVMLPVILLIISLSDTIHLINKYDYLITQIPSNDAIIQASKVIGQANLITSLTTAIGFLGLYFIPIEPIRDFGLFTALGIMIAFVLTMTLVPSLCYFFPDHMSKSAQSHKLVFSRWIVKLTQFDRKGKLITIVLSLVLVAGIPFLKLNTGLIVGLQKDEPMLQQVAYFDKNYNGYRPLEVGVKLSGLRPTDSIVMAKIDMIEIAAQEIYAAKDLQSSNQLVKKINAGLYGGSTNYNTLPKADDRSRVRRFYNSRKLDEVRKSISSDSLPYLRIVGLTQDRGSAFFLDQNETFEQMLAEINDDQFEARLTGSSYLIDKTDKLVINALIKGLLFACLTVAIIVMLFYKSWRAAVVVLIVNSIPLILLFGTMGILDISLNLSTAIIFTVALGIAVDDSIHFISRYELEKRAGRNKQEALKLAKLYTGKSILFTTITISTGFAVLLLSGFSAVYYMGLFICISALLALWFDLKVLPYFIERWPRL
jgi:predicted RND superfamily exporter protein